MSGPKPIVVVGSINTDLVSVTERIPLSGETVLGSDFHIYPGGKGANQAVAVARLGYPVRMIGRVGTDSFGCESSSHLKRAGVDTELIDTTEGPSGIAVICVSVKGENSIIVTPGANGTLTPADIEAHTPAIREAGAVLAQLEIPLETVEYLAEICGRECVPFILDPAPARKLSDRLLAHVTWLTPNQTEAVYYRTRHAAAASFDAMSAARELLQRGTRGVVLKMGEGGALVSDHNGGSHVVPAFQVKAIDTTAAGDAFNGGFAVGLMRGMSPIESARFAAAVAAISVTRSGAQPSMPTLKEVERFIAQQSSEGA